jgi:hypothetical protein
MSGMSVEFTMRKLLIILLMLFSTNPSGRLALLFFTTTSGKFVRDNDRTFVSDQRTLVTTNQIASQRALDLARAIRPIGFKQWTQILTNFFAGQWTQYGARTSVRGLTVPRKTVGGDRDSEHQEQSR